jgi:nucleotide-binding universal stress UspA family protein
MQAEYDLLLVVTPASLPWDAVAGEALSEAEQHLLERIRAEAEAYLDAVAQPLRARSLPVRRSVVVGQPAAWGILDEARRQGVDLIALATHGRRGLQRLRLGSVADKVGRGASCSVLVYRPPTE